MDAFKDYMFNKVEFIEEEIDRKYIKNIEKEAMDGNSESQFKIGYCYQYGIFCGKNINKATAYYKKAVEQGNISAKCNLASFYMLGVGVPRNYIIAAKLYREAAEDGNTVAKLNLGICLDEGYGVDVDHKEALSWLLEASEEGNDTAMENVGVHYKEGYDVPVDFLEAVKWFRKAAELGNVRAINDLGWCYHLGNGVSKNMFEAVRLYQRAAEKGLAEAQYNLAQCCLDGAGISRSIEGAIKLLKKSAKGGDFAALEQLVDMYNSGDSLALSLISAEGLRAMARENNRKFASSAAIAEEQKSLFAEYKTHLKENINDASPFVREVNLLNAGKEAKRAGDFKKAIELYKEAIKLVPENGSSYYSLGKLLYLMGEYEQSFKAYILAYINKANCDKVDLFYHAGHALLDCDETNKVEYSQLIAMYRNTLMGNRYVTRDFVVNEYQKKCKKLGEECILEHATDMSR